MEGNEFIKDADVISPDEKTSSPGESFLPATQTEIFDVQKVQRIIELAKAFQQIANEKNENLNAVSGDIKEFIKTVAQLLEITGLNELFKGEEPDLWSMISIMSKTLRKVYRERDNPNSVYHQMGRTFLDFVKKYNNAENFDEHGQFKLPKGTG